MPIKPKMTSVNVYRRCIKVSRGADLIDEFLVRVDSYPYDKYMRTCVCRAATCEGCDGSACIAHRNFDYAYPEVQSVDAAQEKAVAYATGAIDAIEATVSIKEGGAIIYTGTPAGTIGRPLSRSCGTKSYIESNPFTSNAA